MKIGINAVAAFTKPRTGVEEYTYQLIKHLAMLEESEKHRFVLYKDPRTETGDFSLTDNFKIKSLAWFGPMWTQLRLSSEMAINQPDVFFIPVHVLPLIHPKNSIVTIHGLEFEYYPEMYPKNHLRYLRWSTKYALKNARKIIAISENTKKDLIELYNGDSGKIEVVHHGVSNVSLRALTKQSRENGKIAASPAVLRGPRNDNIKPYILYLGRLEAKKNIQGLVRAFDLLKKRYQIPHQLVLAGSKGYGYDKISLKKDIIEKGYVSEKEKWQLLKNADMFVFPTFYEGFGMPILEAQMTGCPTITSNISSIPEVAGEGAILIEPRNVEEICERMYQLITDRDFRKRLINEGYRNVKKFSWEKCAQETLNILVK